MEEQHYLALYRKYRPQTFEDVRGRDTIVRTLKNQINAGRIGHSYLFCGTRGTGKTSIAKIFAKAVNCEHPQDGSPCGECESCRAIGAGASLNVVELDAASNNSVDDIRNIIEQVSYSPTQGKYRVYIIDEAHMLSNSASNALLKTLEEPPSYAIFILATTEPDKLPVTILSRCQRYDFGRLSTDTIAGRLREVSDSEHLDVEEKALHYIAAAADGSMRDGLSLLDQCNAFNLGSGTLTYDKTLEILGAVDVQVFGQLYRSIHEGQIYEAIQILDRILTQGRELVQFVTDYIRYLRNLMLLKASEQIADSLDISSENLKDMINIARRSEMPEIMRSIRIFSALLEEIRYSSNRRILTEMAMIRASRPLMGPGGGPNDPAAQDPERQLEQFQERIRVLERQVLTDQEKIADLEQAPPAAALTRVNESGNPTGNEDGFSQSGSAERAGNPDINEAVSGTGNGVESGSGPAASGSTPGTTYGANQSQSTATAIPAENASVGKSGKADAQILRDAVPEEIRKVIAHWDELIARAQDGLLKAALRKSGQSLGNDGQLVIVFNNRTTCDIFAKNEENRKWLEDLLAQETGCRIRVDYKALDKGEKFTDNYVNLKDVITMPVEETLS